MDTNPFGPVLLFRVVLTLLLACTACITTYFATPIRPVSVTQCRKMGVLAKPL